MKMSARQIVNHYCKGKMSARPEFYSGRGVNGDLTNQHLEMIYDGVLQEHGADAARHYVNMVADVSMAATTFLINLYDLERCDWKWETETPDNTFIEVEKDEDGNYDSLSGMMGIMGFLSGNRDTDPASIEMASDRIRFQFLRHHDDELEECRKTEPYESIYGCSGMSYGFRSVNGKSKRKRKG